MKRKILSMLFMLILCISGIVYAIDANPVYSILYVTNSIMSIIISLIVIYFFIKIFKSNEKKKWIIKFINIISVALILKWGAIFWIYGIIYFFAIIFR